MRTIIVAMAAALLISGLPAQDAKAFLKQVQQKYRQMKSMEATVVINFQASGGSTPMKQQARSSLAIQKPNKVAMKSSGGSPMAQQEVYSDGKDLFIYMPAMKQYLKRPAPANFDGPAAGLLGYLGMLLGFANENLDDPNSRAKYVFRGKRTIAGKPTRIVEVTESRQGMSAKIRLFVGEQDKLIYRLEMEQQLQQAAGQQGQPARPSRITLQADIRYISFNKPIPASRFKFTPPKGTTEMQMPRPSGAPMTPPGGGGR